MFKGLYSYYPDIEGLVTKKEATGNFRWLYHELGMDLDLMSQVKQPEPVVDGNTIIVYSPVPAAAPIVEQAAAPAPQPQPAPEKNYFDDLKKLNDLKEAGVITEEEYNKKKEEILSKI